MECLPHHVESVVTNGTRQTHSGESITRETYPPVYWPGDSDFSHIEFALKREGLHLQLLRTLLPRLSAEEVTAYVRSKPTSGYARRIWLLYEEFSGKRLENLPDAAGNYVELLDSREYYTGPPVRSSRHRVNVNLLGSFAFSPMVRRTKRLRAFEGKRLASRCREIIQEISPGIYTRAIQYLYSKETKSSYAIERETPDQKRTRRFSNALKEAPERDYLSKEALVSLQQTIVDQRFANKGWRDQIDDQVYVGRSVSMTEEEVHFIAPQPKDLPELMPAFLETSSRILSSEIDSVIAAAMIAYSFIFLHPFTDGNGRIHRFLIHYVLSRRGFAPKGVVFPVSAIMLHRERDYDASLESFSKLLLPLIDYELDSSGKMTVKNETRDFYRYIDCTAATEALYSFVEETIEKELPAGFQFLRQYDKARQLMQDIVDLPNRHADLFVRLCLQNNKKLSETKRKLPEFASVTDREIHDLEAAISEAFSNTEKS